MFMAFSKKSSDTLAHSPGEKSPAVKLFFMTKQGETVNLWPSSPRVTGSRLVCSLGEGSSH